MTNTFSTKPINTWLDTQITLWRIWHSTVLINFYGTWIITDPVFAMAFGVPLPRTSWNIWARRVRNPHISIKELPHIDIVLLSHAHMDHLHPYSCKAIYKHSEWKTEFVVAPWVYQWLHKHIQTQTHELDWGWTKEVCWVSITACEVNHRWARYPWAADRSKWHPTWASYNAYLLEKNWKKIFFWWDTAYTTVMKSYAPVWWVDLAIMPIWSYDPWIVDHCNPEQALQMAQMVGAKSVVGIHRDSRWRPYKKRELDKPLKRFLEAAPSYWMDVLWQYEWEVVVLK